MNTLHLTEQATLGALMLDPDLPAQTAGWLRSEDFTDPWHAHVHKVIRELATARQPTGPHDVGRAMIERLGHRVADAPRIVDLLQAAPVHPVGREYAALVVEASIRRQVARFGVLLQGAALTAVTTESAAVLDAVTGQIDAMAISAERRHALATGAPMLRAVDALSTAGPAVLPLQLAADRALASHPTPNADEILGREATLVAALVTRPQHTQHVAAWLRADKLTSDSWRPAYQAVLHLHGTGQRVDEITVAWELHRMSAVNGPGPTVDELRQTVADASSIDVHFAARMVAGDQLRLAADQAAQALCVDAANPGLDVRDLLETTGLLTAALRSTAAQLDPVARPAPEPDLVPSLPALRLVAPEAVLSR